MTIKFDTPGVHILEQTGPGVIAGVGTSTAAFLGPAPTGPVEPRRITSFDEFLSLYATTDSDGNAQPFIVSSQRFYLPFAVRGFFDNGGQKAFIVRVSSGRAAAWTVLNQGGEPIFLVRAKQQGTAANDWTVAVNENHLASGLKLAIGKTTVSFPPEQGGLVVPVADPAPFKPEDLVTKDGTSVAKIKSIDVAAKKLTLESAIVGLKKDDPLRIADFVKDQRRVRLASTTNLLQGAVVKITQGTDVDWGIVESIDQVGFVTFASSPARTHDFKTETASPNLESFEFDIVVTPRGGTAEVQRGLSLQPLHRNYVFFSIVSNLIEVVPPKDPPLQNGFPAALPNTTVPPVRANGQNDDPGTLTKAHYQTALDALKEIDDVNILCAPDAAANAQWLEIQTAMIDHCVALEDRFAVLDAQREATPDTILEQRKKVESPSGRAALYFPWLLVRDPLDKRVPAGTIPIPPSGHIAGIYARTDQERGVHKAPANTEVRGGVLGLQHVLSDARQGLLNPEGINVLRIFQGSASVIVWGARTTVRKDITDWIYVPVRRLMLFIEESIEEGIRFAVFEPNNQALWKKLERTIREFLTRVWRDGALFGETPDQAFRVRIDEALNPPSVRALGQLFVEIRVAAVRPAEFIIVKIGLFDGGAEIQEG